MTIRFTAFSEDHEFKGSLIIGYKKALYEDEFAHFFEEHGFGDVDPDKWYPAQDLLDVFSEMQAASRGFLDFVSIGMASANLLGIPPQVDRNSPEQVLQVIATIQATTGRTSHPGYVKTEQLGDHHYRIDARAAIPDDMVYGALYALAKNFVPTSSHLYLAYPDGGKRRDSGDELTTFDLTWD